MATVTSLGVGSGLDLNGLLTKLMAVEQQPITQLQNRSLDVQSKISAYGTIKGALSTLQTAAKALNTKEKFSAYKATVADTTVASAVATGTAAAGSYALEVTQLAQAQKIKSAGYAASSTTIATGTLTLEIGTYNGTTFTADGSKTKTITIDSSNNTLAGLRDAINGANAGVTATLVNDGSATPYRLVLTSDNTGTANSFKLSGLTGFDFDPAASGAGSLSQIQGSKDALFKLDNIDITKSSNVVTDAIDGLTLTLTKENPGTPTTINVVTDTSAVKDKINAFVKAYNDLNSQIKTLSAYNATTKTAGVLNGDSLARSVQSELRTIIGGTLSSGTLTRLSDAGISIGVDGALTVNSTKLDTVLTDPSKNAYKLFADADGVSGFADQLADKIDTMLQTDGIIATRTEGLNQTVKSYNTRIDALQSRLTKIQERYTRQFSALDTLVSGLNQTSQYLSQQLASLPGVA